MSNNKTLSKATVEEIHAELAKRKVAQKDLEYITIKNLRVKGITTKRCSVHYTIGEYGPLFGFFVTKGKKDLDFYYESDLSYEEQQSLIPSGFGECMENVYEFHLPNQEKLSDQQIVDEAIQVLKKCGYQTFVRIESF